MSENVYAVIETNGSVSNVIVADKAFIDGLPALVADEDVDTGDLLSTTKYVNITNKNPRPTIGWTYSNSKFVEPPPPPPIPVEDLLSGTVLEDGTIVP